jgi:MerR family transcriptional regulator, thiopeptide resistance regulator
MTTSLTPEERREVFGDHDPEQYAEEVEQRWGDTETYRQSQQRAAAYTKSDWEEIKAEAGAISNRFAELLASGAAPDSTAAMDAAEQHRQHITSRFYDCSLEIHKGLGDMYVADERFAQNYESVAEGLSQYIRDAIHANAARH